MHPALNTLTYLRYKATFRRLFTGMKSVRGAVLTIIAIGFFVFAVAPSLMFVDVGSSADADHLGRYGPVFLLIYTVLTFITNISERAFFFTLSEVEFLFPAPFTRRDLLTYKLRNAFASALFVGCIAWFSLRSNVHLSGAAIVGAALGYLFITLLTILFALARQSISTRMYTRSRKIVLGVAIALIAVAFMFSVAGSKGSLDLAKTTLSSPVLKIASAPFSVFCKIMTSKTYNAYFFLLVVIGIVLNGFVTKFIYALDTDFRDTSVRISEQVYDKLQKMRGGNALNTALAPKKAEFHCRMLPFWRGAGPIIWQEAMCALRAFRVAILLLIVPILVMGTIFLKVSDGEQEAGFILGAIAYGSIISSMSVASGFRRNFGFIEVYKTVPVTDLAIVCGQIFPAALFYSVAQWCVLAACAAIFSDDAQIYFSAICIVPFFNLLLFGISNGVFLLVPTKLTKGVAQDLQTVAKNLLAFFLQFVSMLLCLSVAITPAAAVFFFSESLPLAILTACSGLLLVDIGIVLLSTWIYRRFDVSKHSSI